MGINTQFESIDVEQDPVSQIQLLVFYKNGFTRTQLQLFIYVFYSLWLLSYWSSCYKDSTACRG